MSLQVLEPGLASLIVDGGRSGWRSLGVPVGGAADRTSWQLGNALVGNVPHAAALELSLRGPTLRAEQAIAAVLVGAPFELRSDRQTLALGKTFTLAAGETLALGGTPAGVRAYLCVRGGFETPVVLDSRTGLAPLAAGDSLRCGPSRVHGRFDPTLALEIPEVCELRVLPGPQAAAFGEQLAILAAARFEVSATGNRMGVRLIGPPLRWPAGELPSEPAAPGTVQVTNDGQCVILGVDGQTIGGYPKIAHVIRADLDRVGQLRPGTHVTFRRVALAEATAAARQAETWLHTTCIRLRYSLDRGPSSCRLQE